uniref:Rab3-GAP regulatory subunit N-terminal domain-containing protein n=1 Tax=Ananas comosus var. bracteatus TaxID=296719 RepID=A0A6V7QYW8_ANACO
MARRSHHLTEVASIAGAGEVGEVGAGEREGWLDDPSLLASLHRRTSLALAHSSRSLLLLLPSPPPPPPSGAAAAIVVGTSAGFLLVYSSDGDLIHKQSIYPEKILRLRFQERKRNFQDSGSEELCVVFPGVIARFDGSDIQNMLQRWFQEAGSRHWGTRFHQEEEEDESAFGRIPFQLWNISKFGSCADAGIAGLMPPPLLEFQSTQRYYCAVTVGEDAVISAYRLSEDRSRSLVGAILSKVVPATFSTIASFSRIIWRSDQTAAKKARPKPQPFAKASPLTCLKDHPRKGDKLTLSPSGTLAAITDSLGRILLLDTQALVVVRLWKGYRDASCLFMEMLVRGDKPSSSSTNYEYTKSDYCLCLAIHAPRKGIIEIWKMRTGPRLLTIPCPKGCKILQPSMRFLSSSSSPSSYTPLEVFLLNGDSGQLSVLSSHIGKYK